MNLALKIQKHRRERGLTQEELAEALNVSHQSISKWESAQTIPGLDKVLLMSEYFQVSTDYLLKDEIENGDTANAASAMVADLPPARHPLPPSVPSSADAFTQTRQTPPKKKTGFFFHLGALFAVAGCSGLLYLWIQSLFHPPYTLGKTLGPLEAFSFYVRYNEFETRLTVAIVTALTGVGILLPYRLRQSIAERRALRNASHKRL